MSFTCILVYFTAMPISQYLQRAHTHAFTLYFLFSPPLRQEKRDSEINHFNALCNTLINFSLDFAHLFYLKVNAPFNQVGSEPSMPCITTLLFCNVIRISIFMKSLDCDTQITSLNTVRLNRISLLIKRVSKILCFKVCF